MSKSGMDYIIELTPLNRDRLTDTYIEQSNIGVRRRFHIQL